MMRRALLLIPLAACDAAMPVISSKTSCDGSAARQAASGISSSARRIISGPVAGVDSDVAFGQVAGPEAGRALSLAAHRHANLAIGRIQLSLELFFGEGRGQPAAAHRHTLHGDAGF